MLFRHRASRRVLLPAVTLVCFSFAPSMIPSGDAGVPTGAAHAQGNIGEKEAFEAAKELGTVRTQKFAVDDEESEDGVRCVGAPIFDHTGRVFAAISVSGPAYRLSVSRLIALSSLVMDTANTISGRVGYVPQN